MASLRGVAFHAIYETVDGVRIGGGLAFWGAVTPEPALSTVQPEPAPEAANTDAVPPPR